MGFMEIMMENITARSGSPINFKPAIESNTPLNRNKQNNARANSSYTSLFSFFLVLFGYLGVANYKKLFPFNGAQTQSNRSTSSSDPGHGLKNLLKPFDMCMIDNASQWPFLKSPNVCEDDDIQINNCQSLQHPIYSQQYWQDLTTLTNEEQAIYKYRISEPFFTSLSGGCCYGFSSLFLTTPTEKFFDQLHDLSYSSTDVQTLRDRSFRERKRFNPFLMSDLKNFANTHFGSEKNTEFMRTLAWYQEIQTNSFDSYDLIPPLTDFCFVEIVPRHTLSMMLGQLSDSQKIMITNQNHAIAIQKIKYDTGESAYLCIDFNLQGQFSPKSLDQAVDFITTMAGTAHRSQLEDLQYYKVHSNGPLKQYTDGHVIERLLLMVEKGRLDQIKHFINTYSMNKLDESKAIVTAARFSQFDTFKYYLTRFNVDDVYVRYSIFLALDTAISLKNRRFLSRLFETDGEAIFKRFRLEEFNERHNLLESCLNQICSNNVDLDWLFNILIDDCYLKDTLTPYNPKGEDRHRLMYRGDIVGDNEEVSALHMAVYFSSRLAVGDPSKYRYINKLLESGASGAIMSRPPLYFSPIHLAIDINDPHALSILLPHASTRDLFSATQSYLFRAAIKKSSEMIQLLMDKFRDTDDYWSRFYLFENFNGGYEDGLKHLICNNIGKYDVDVFYFLLNHAHFSEDQLNDLKLEPIFNQPKYSEYLSVIDRQLTTINT